MLSETAAAFPRQEALSARPFPPRSALETSVNYAGDASRAMAFSKDR
jgi:hypothetical protein